MFYIIHHKPTNTWVPLMKTNLSRSMYYKFIQGDLPAQDYASYKDTLNFIDGYKYKSKVDAEKLIDSISYKFKNNVDTPAQFKEQFEVQEYNDIPFEYVELHRKVRVNKKINIISKQDNNWQNLSREYCCNCGTYIPAQQLRAVFMSTTSICRLCVEEMHNILKEDKSVLPEQLSKLEAARVVGML